jgi:transcriptional regulator with XRE-family HTH domain
MYRADLIQAAMEEQGKSVQDVAEESGLTRPTIYNLLAGKHKPELDTLQAVGQALRIPLSKLIVEQTV